MARDFISVLQQVIDARLVMRLDKLDVGVLALSHGLYIPVRVDGQKVMAQIGAVAGTVIAFSNEAEAWDWLEQHSEKASDGDDA